MGLWQGVTMDSLKFHPGPPCPTLLRPAGGPPLKRPCGLVAYLQGWWSLPVVYPFGYPTPYAYLLCLQVKRNPWFHEFWETKFNCRLPLNITGEKTRKAKQIGDKICDGRERISGATQGQARMGGGIQGIYG
jgi:hypothetical protein